jgi:ribosome-binding protein aMBF1 (putative translation factor)
VTESRRRRLQARGWIEGTAADFLGLTPEEEAYIELKLRLSDAVRELRRKRGLTQAQLAEQLGSSQSRIAKIEAGDASVSLDLLARSLLTLGASPKAIARALAG